MQFRRLSVPDALEFSPRTFPDDRGLFVAPFQEEAFRVASSALPEFPVVLRYGGEEDGVVDVHLTDAVTITTALNLGALLGAVVVQLHAEGWATRWEPVGTPGGSSLVGRLWLGALPA